MVNCTESENYSYYLKYEYDANGNHIKTYSGKKASTLVEEYEYDKDNNLTKKQPMTKMAISISIIYMNIFL